MSFHQQKLANGLEIIGETHSSSLCVALAFWVQTGARDETQEVSGVSHFLEHMVFKGTPHRNSIEVNRDFSRIGADSNAFTSEESTVFHITVLPEYLEKGVEVLADILRPSLRGEDFDTEKKVILDEIVRYEVQPNWATYDTARKTFYGTHPLGNSVLGSTASVTALNRDQMAAYFDSRYVASNIKMVAAGNFDWDKLVGLIEKSCASWPKGDAPRKDRREAKGKGGLHIVTRPKDKVAQQYFILIAPGPAADSPLRYAASILATAVGDYTGSRLFWALTDPGLADEAGMGTDECDAAGAFYTSFNSAPENADECYQIVTELLADIQKNSITDAELEQARTKIVSREVRSRERTHRRMLALGKDWVYLGQYRTLDDELAAWEAVTPKMVREVLDRYPVTQYTATTLGPLEKITTGGG